MNTVGTISAGGVAVIAFVLGYYIRHRKIWPKVVPVMWLISGLGVAGTLGGVLDWTGTKLVDFSTTATRTLFGVGVPLALCFVMVLAMVLAYMPKGPGVTKWTPWVALLLPAVLLATGGMAADLGSGLQTAFGSATTGGLAALGEAVRSFR